MYTGRSLHQKRGGDLIINNHIQSFPQSLQRSYNLQNIKTMKVLVTKLVCPNKTIFSALWLLHKNYAHSTGFTIINSTYCTHTFAFAIVIVLQERHLCIKYTACDSLLLPCAHGQLNTLIYIHVHAILTVYPWLVL